MLAPAQVVTHQPSTPSLPSAPPPQRPPSLDTHSPDQVLPGSTFAPDDMTLPASPGIPPVGPSAAQRHFKVTDQQAFLWLHNESTRDMQRLHTQQPSFKAFVQAQLEQAFPAVRPLDPDTLVVNTYRQNGATEQLVSSEPLMSALAKAIQDVQANPNKLSFNPRNLRSEFVVGQTPTTPGTPTVNASPLHAIARSIATQYPAALQEYWETPRPGEKHPESPQDQLLALHKEQLSTMAALRVSDGTLSPASKRLINAALQYPTLAERETAFANGARPGVYPVTVDDGTEHGALLPGAFLITRFDGSWATAPTWPKGRTLTLNEGNGPVVLYTPGEGFEEFASPAQARQALAKRLDQGGQAADLLKQSLPLTLQNRPEPLSGEDLMRSVEPLAGDVLAEGIPWMLKRQSQDVQALIAQIEATTPLADPTTLQRLDQAADWSYLLDGNNSLLARNNKLADTLQPEWLKNLPPVQQVIFQKLEHAEEKSAGKLIPLLERIPSLTEFSRDKMNEAIKKRYPTAQVDADQLKVRMQTRTRTHTGRPSGHESTATQNAQLSLTDLALKNPTEFPAGESAAHTQITFSLPLTDTQGKPVLDAAGNPVVLNTDQLKTLVNTADVGGEYTKLLKEQLDTDADSGPAGALRTSWKANQADVMEKEAFLAELNPDAYTAEATTDTTTKRGAQWVRAVLDHPDPTNRPKVDGKDIVANTLVQHGLTVQGVLVIGNQTDAARVLYAPNAPDGVAFRELADQNALASLLEKPEWKRYTAGRKSPVNKDDIEKVTQKFKSNPLSLLTNPLSAIELLIDTRKFTGGAALNPITGNVQDELYKQQVQMLIDKADHQSVSSAEVAEQSTTNKIKFGIEVASVFLDLLPVVGKGLSTGLRLSKAAVTALRANAKVLPGLIKNPGLGRAIYADFTTSAAGIPLFRSAPLRPVATAGGNTLRATPPALTQSTGSLPAGTSTGTGTTAALPNRDLSAYTLPDSVIQNRPLRPDGTYNVGDNWYIRYTDSTGANKVYQIDSAFHARSGQVNIVDPNAPLTAPKSSRIKASLQSAGNGEWRLSELPGGSRHRGRTAPPLDEYMDRIITGKGADDFTDATGATVGHIRRWFKRDMQDFYNSMSSGQMPVRSQLGSIGMNATPKSAVQNALAHPDVRGLVFGEVHDEPATYQLLIDQMQTYKNSGVTTLYLEGAPFLQKGPGFGTGAYEAADAVYAWPRPYDPAYTAHSPTLEDLIKAANQNGIKVIGLEHRELTLRADNRVIREQTNRNFYRDRLKELNYFSTQIINQTPAGEKFVAVVGKYHMSTYDNIPGISDLTGAVGVSVSPTPKGVPSTVSQPPHTPPPPLKLLHGTDVPEPTGEIHIDYNIDKITV